MDDDALAALAGIRVRITAEEMRLIAEVIEGHCGISLGHDSGFFLERRLGPRLDALGMTSFRDYYHHLRYDPPPEELEELVERITTHETYFFREQYQLDAFSEVILPDLARRRGDEARLSIWSAGCSTGEEAYTLAMLLLDSGRFRGWSMRVFGSDISPKVLATARAATYGASSFRATEPAVRRRHFHEVAGKSALRDHVRSMCAFGQLNLLHTDRYRLLGPVDVIFCRNVLMYLSPPARLRIVEAFYDQLAPGGWLLLGHSESLLNVTTRFELANLEKDLVYRKPIA